MWKTFGTWTLCLTALKEKVGGPLLNHSFEGALMCAVNTNKVTQMMYGWTLYTKFNLFSMCFQVKIWTFFRSGFFVLWNINSNLYLCKVISDRIN